MIDIVLVRDIGGEICDVTERKSGQARSKKRGTNSHNHLTFNQHRTDFCFDCLQFVFRDAY